MLEGLDANKERKIMPEEMKTVAVAFPAFI